MPFPDDVFVTNVAAGTFHSLALTTHGVLWAWGRDVSICAENHLKAPAVFEQLESPEGVPRCKMITCYGDHSFAVTLSGQVCSKRCTFSAKPALLFKIFFCKGVGMGRQQEISTGMWKKKC